MILEFVKTGRERDRLTCTLPDGVKVQIDCPFQGIMPHELFHYAVEREVQVKGFLWLVKNGSSVSFQMASNAESEAVERLVEIFQARAWSGVSDSALDLIDQYRQACKSRGNTPLDVTAADVERMANRIRSLAKRWASLAKGDALTLKY